MQKNLVAKFQCFSGYFCYWSFNQAPCSVGEEKFSLALPFKKSTCPRQALIELWWLPHSLLWPYMYYKLQTLCLLYSQWITSTPTCLHADVCVWCQNGPVTGLCWSCGKSLASRSVHLYQQYYHYNHAKHFYRTIWLWQKRGVTSKHISARTTEWCIKNYKCNSLKSWTEGWHTEPKTTWRMIKTMLRSLFQKNVVHF